ncbi:MAG: YIP1 family protein [Pseudomonadota bacterium]
MSPLRTIWLRPGETVRAIAHENPGYRVFSLPIIAGFCVLPSTALLNPRSIDEPVGFLMGSIFAFGPLLELLQLFVGAYLLRVTGAWLGGSASSTRLQTTIAWSNVPIVVLGIIGIAVLFASSAIAFENEEWLSWGSTPAINLVGFALVALQVVFVVWSGLIFLTGLAALQRFSLARAIVNAALAWGIVASAIVAVLLLSGLADMVTSVFFSGFEPWLGSDGGE